MQRNSKLVAAAIAILWSSATIAQTTSWVADELSKLAGDLQKLETELEATEKRARESRNAHIEAEQAWMVCVAFGRTIDEMNDNKDKLERARVNAEAHRGKTEDHRTNLERFHGQIKLARLQVEHSKGLDYDRQLLERYINPMRSAYFPNIKSVLDSYDSYTATMSAYQGVFMDAGDRCRNTRTIGNWLSLGVKTVLGVATQLPTAAQALKETAKLLQNNGDRDTRTESR